MSDPYDFDPSNNLIPSMDYNECVKLCDVADPVKEICGKITFPPLKTLCQLTVGASKEACMNFCEIFQDGKPSPPKK